MQHNIVAQVFRDEKEETRTNDPILLHYFGDSAQGTLGLSVENAEKLCNDLGLALAELRIAKEKQVAHV